ncbi:restriction endonuclease subunit S [Lactococcus cremoris]|uniref:restriction endonuclease subunit S n=1 Tax=Lactococcus lactis subsp. cremoris TaxID=1359 RepID=UPI0024A61C66|nr:restriction endonuclease subunit S [Lactococcus cremoris]
MNSNKFSKWAISDFVEIIGGGTPKTSISEYWNGSIPWLSVKDFGNDDRYVFETEKTITNEGLNNSSTKLLQKDDIIISARGTVGELAMLPFPMAFNQSCYGIRPKDDSIDKTFLYYLLRNSVQLLRKNTHGSVFDTITRDTFKGIEVEVPSIEEQVKIAGILSSLDDKIAENKKINHHLAEILQVNLAQQLNEVHEKYRIGDLELTVSDHVANGSFKSLKENVELVEKPDYALFLRNVDLKNKLNGDRRYVTESSYEFLKKSRLYGHEVIISNVADVGSVHRVPKMNMPMVAGNNVVFLQADNGLLTDYLYVYFNSRLGQHDIESITSGSAQQKFNKTDFRNLEIPILNDKIIRNQITPLLRYMDNVNGEISRLIELRDSLLPRLMSGEISVTD